MLTWKNLNKLPPTSPSAGIIFELEKEMMIVSFEAVMMIGARRLNSSSLITIYRSLLLCVSRLLHQIRLNQRALLFLFFSFFFLDSRSRPAHCSAIYRTVTMEGTTITGREAREAASIFYRLKNRNSFDVWFHFEPHSSLSPPPLAQHWEMIEIFVRRTDWDFFSFPSATGITAFEKKKKVVLLIKIPVTDSRPYTSPTIGAQSTTKRNFLFKK